jgi:hypothetical protein
VGARNSGKRGKPWLGGDDGIRRGGESIGGVLAVMTFDGEVCDRGSGMVWVRFRG